MAFPKLDGILAASAILLGSILAHPQAAHAHDAASLLTMRATSSTGAEVVAQLSLADLDALDQHRFETTTIWTEGSAVYTGPLLRDVIDSVGGDGTGAFRAIAANGYFVEFPAGAAGADAPIIATRIDGATYGVREKGPLWVIYPYASDRRYATETIHARSIWQLTEIEFQAE